MVLSWKCMRASMWDLRKALSYGGRRFRGALIVLS